MDWERRKRMRFLGSGTKGVLLCSHLSCRMETMFSFHDLLAIPGLPRSEYFKKVSTHMAFPGTICSVAMSPDSRGLELSSSFLPHLFLQLYKTTRDVDCVTV
jgi:hypothetical protein